MEKRTKKGTEKKNMRRKSTEKRKKGGEAGREGELKE
jgi:hypothetical protein